MSIEDLGNNSLVGASALVVVEAPAALGTLAALGALAALGTSVGEFSLAIGGWFGAVEGGMIGNEKPFEGYRVIGGGQRLRYGKHCHW